MTKIHLNRDRESLGQFTPEAVAEGLQSGRFKPTDLAWREGMDAWKPLSEWSDLPAISADVPILPSATLAPGSPLAEFSDVKPGVILPSWESETNLSFFQQLAATVKECIGHPGSTFSNLSKSPKILRPFLYFLILATLSSVVSVSYEMAFSMANPERLTSQAPNFPVEWIIPIYIFVMCMMPVLVSLIAFISAAMYHLGLMLTGNAKEGFATTFRVACYVQGSTSIFQLIPFCGQYIQLVLNLVGTTIGLHKAHKIGIGPAIIAVVLPFVLCCGLIIALVSLGLGAAAFGAAAK